MTKQLSFDDLAKNQLYEGIRKLAGAVKVTLGPSGRNVIIEKKFGSPQATKDGVTVSKEIELEQPFENCGAKLANAAADKTNDVAGDGTTTAVVLVEAMYKEGLKALAAEYKPSLIKKGMAKAAKVAVGVIEKMAVPVKDSSDYYNVALVASHYDKEVAQIVSDSISRVGKDGVITVEESKSFETSVEHVDGMQFDKGYISPYFINKPDSQNAEYEDCYLLLTDKKISNAHDLIPILEQIAETGSTLAIVAEEVEAEALALLVVNKLRGALRVVAVKAPAFGDRRKAILQDIAVLTGAKVVSDELGISIDKITLKDLGRAKKIVVEKERTTIIGGGGSKKQIEARINEIRTLITKTTSDYDKEKYQERLGKLLGGISIINVGGPTEATMKERKFRVEDAVKAVKAAAEEGIVPGAGTCYIRAIKEIEGLKLTEDEKAGAMVVSKALESVLYNVSRNAGYDSQVVVHDVKECEGSKGFNALTGEFENLIKSGVVDAAKVERAALQNAASIVGLLITSKAVITELKDAEKQIEGVVK